MLVVRLVGRATHVPERLMFDGSRGCADVAEARQLAMYLLHVSLGRNMADVGHFFGRDRTTVAHACGRVEDRRDREEFETVVAGLERALSNLVANPRQLNAEAGRYARL